jgi:class 3 adenylate cyclase
MLARPERRRYHFSTRAHNDSRAPIRVLAADDEEPILSMLSVILKEQGYEFFPARSGPECIALAVQTKPDVILLDVHMPGMDGFEAALALSANEETSSIPIIMVTGLSTSADRVRGLKAGAVDFLAKPVESAMLIAKVSSLARLKVYNDEMKRRHASLRTELAGRGEQLQAALEAFARFIPQEFLRALGKTNIVDVKLGDQVQLDMAILFSDIRSFTALSEKMTPEQNFSFLNSYLSRMNPFIWENGGFIDKYIGDAIMALFPVRPDDAIAAAVAMHRKLITYNADRAKTGYVPISIGIGVNLGTLMLGTVGEHERMDGSVISDAVNLCSRLETLTRVYGSGILTTGRTLKALSSPGRVSSRFIDRVRVRGRREAVLVFEVLDGETDEQRRLRLSYRSEMAHAQRLYFSRDFTEAHGTFAALRRGNPGDPVLEIYQARCERLLKEQVPDAWEGVEEIEVR